MHNSENRKVNTNISHLWPIFVTLLVVYHGSAKLPIICVVLQLPNIAILGTLTKAVQIYTFTKRLLKRKINHWRWKPVESESHLNCTCSSVFFSFPSTSIKTELMMNVPLIYVILSQFIIIFQSFKSTILTYNMVFIQCVQQSINNANHAVGGFSMNFRISVPCCVVVHT